MTAVEVPVVEDALVELELDVWALLETVYTDNLLPAPQRVHDDGLPMQSMLHCD